MRFRLVEASTKEKFIRNKIRANSKEISKDKFEVDYENDRDSNDLPFVIVDYMLPPVDLYEDCIINNKNLILKEPIWLASFSPEYHKTETNGTVLRTCATEKNGLRFVDEKSKLGVRPTLAILYDFDLRYGEIWRFCGHTWVTISVEEDASSYTDENFQCAYLLCTDILPEEVEYSKSYPLMKKFLVDNGVIL